MIYQNLKNKAKAVLKGKFVSLSLHIIKEKKGEKSILVSIPKSRERIEN